MKQPSGTVSAIPDPRPWWAVWRSPTAAIVCSEHGVVKARVPAFISEAGFDPVWSIAQVHVVSQHSRSES